MPVASKRESSASGLAVPNSVPRDRFRAWFGQSKVVNEDGTPRRVYHGTIKDFASFMSKKRNPELGFHFGSLSQAEFFAGYGSQNSGASLGCIMPVYLRIENPLRMFDVFERGRRSAENIADWLRRDGVIDRRTRDRVFAARTGREACLRIATALGALGHDGIVYGNEWEGGDEYANEDAYAIFRPEQVKSIFNRGAFDSSSACILE